MTVEIEGGNLTGGKNDHRARIRSQKLELEAGKEIQNRG